MARAERRTRRRRRTPVQPSGRRPAHQAPSPARRGRTAKGSTRPPTRAERRRAVEVRRARAALVAAVALAVVIVAAWFPATALVQQRRALNTVGAQLSTLRAQDRALTAEEKSLSQPAEIGRLARSQYQLVAPGQQAYQVLTPNGSGQSSTTGGTVAPYPSDPGLARPAAPSVASELPPGTTTTGASGGSTTATTAAPGAGRSTRPAATPPADSGFFHRLVQTLEFWR